MVKPWSHHGQTNHGLPWLPSMNNHVQNMVDHGLTMVLMPGQCVTSALFLGNMLQMYVHENIYSPYVHENINFPYVFEFWVTYMLREVPMRMFSSLTERRNILQGFWYFARSRSREFQVNPRNPVKFTKAREIPRNSLEILPNTC